MTVLPLMEYDAADIKRIRNDIGVTQVVFASILGVSKKTVEAWEAGRNKPDGPARRLLAMVQKDPTILDRYCIAEDLDPDFTKVTPAEAARIGAAENSGFVSEDEIDWDNLAQYAD